MKTIFPLLLLFCVAIFSSCTEELTPDTPTKISPEQYLMNLDQSIIFQFIQLDENEEWESGWAIDYQGNVHEFSVSGRLAQNQENMDCPGTFVLESLLNYADGIIGEVDLATLADYHRSLHRVNTGNWNTTEMESPTNYAYYGLQKIKRSEHYVNNGSCDGNGSTSFQSHTVNYITLERTTATATSSNSTEAQEILSWMKQLDTEF